MLPNVYHPVGRDILQRHLASAACTRASFVCVVRKKLLLENEFPTQVKFMHPGLPGETVAYFLVLLHTFFLLLRTFFFLLLHKFLYCCYLFFIVACLFFIVVIFFYCCKPNLTAAIEKLLLHASGRFGEPYNPQVSCSGNKAGIAEPSIGPSEIYPWYVRSPNAGPGEARLESNQFS